ncbi:MAG: family N-acetyltransferase [Segetibacter sp.]|nr:family N-acetyltransferase [Segetibacter sp.]
MTERGKGWVYEVENRIVGFTIVDVKGKNIWALFVDPLPEFKGIGSKLHEIIHNWFFSKHNETIG